MSDNGTWFLLPVLPEDLGTGGAARVFVDLGTDVTDCAVELELELSSEEDIFTGVLSALDATTPWLAWLLLTTFISFVACCILGSAGSWRRPEGICDGTSIFSEDLEFVLPCNTCSFVSFWLLYWMFVVSVPCLGTMTSLSFGRGSLDLSLLNCSLLFAVLTRDLFFFSLFPCSKTFPLTVFVTIVSLTSEVLWYLIAVEFSETSFSLVTALFSSICGLAGRGDSSLGKVGSSTLRSNWFGPSSVFLSFW